MNVEKKGGKNGKFFKMNNIHPCENIIFKAEAVIRDS